MKQVHMRGTLHVLSQMLEESLQGQLGFPYHRLKNRGGVVSVTNHSDFPWTKGYPGMWNFQCSNQ